MNKKIVFQLLKESDEFPPVDYESVWAVDCGNGSFIIDNIPFFATEATYGDLVRCVEIEGEMRFKSLLRPSLNSLIRIVYFECADPGDIQSALREFGCATELNQSHRLIAVSVPHQANLDAVQRFLMDGYEKRLWGYEEPILRR